MDIFAAVLLGLVAANALLVVALMRYYPRPKVKNAVFLWLPCVVRYGCNPSELCWGKLTWLIWCVPCSLGSCKALRTIKG